MSRGAAAIRGAGVVSPLAVGFDELCLALIDGGRVSPPTLPGLSTAAVTEDLAGWFDTPKTYLDRASALTLAAANLARRHAGWDSGGAAPDRCGIALGTAYGCPDSMIRFWQSVVEKGPRLANPLFFTHSYPNTPASMEAIEHSLAGPHFTFCQGSASGALAVASALDTLRLGRADRMVAGGFEALSPARSGESDCPLIPWGEGAAILCLEPMSPNPSEPAPVGRILGSGLSSFCRSAITRRRQAEGHSGAAPRFLWGYIEAPLVQEAVREAMRRAIADAGIRVIDVDMVVLSGTACPILAEAEMIAIGDVLGSETAARTVCTAISDRLGLAAGASAVYGIVAALIGLREEWVIETAAPLPEVAGLKIAREPVEQDVRIAVVNSLDVGGACTSLVIAR